jgi:hypothetical protein
VIGESRFALGEHAKVDVVEHVRLPVIRFTRLGVHNGVEWQ